MNERTADATRGAALASGGAILAAAMMAANAGNYAINLLLGRWLSPAEFADANLMVTLMLLVTAIAVALQLVAARFAGVHRAKDADDRADAIARWLRRRGVIAGVVLGAALAGPATWWQHVFHTGSALPFVVLGVGMPAYLAQAVGRGVLQGRLSFVRLAVTFVVEMVVRVSVAIGLVVAGFGVTGATWGLTASFFATWLAVAALSSPSTETTITTGDIEAVRLYVTPVLVLLFGQILINNGDVLVVKRFFEPDVAGVYAAVALIGRAVFFVSWSAVTTLFPAVAQREEVGESSDHLLVAGLAVVGAACAAMTLGAWWLGDWFLTGALGDAYAGVGSLLVRYAFVTSLFALANVMVTFHLSAGRTWSAKLLLAGAIVQTVLLLARHDSLDTVVNVQLVAMAALLLATAAASAGERRTRTRTDQPATGMQLVGGDAHAR